MNKFDEAIKRISEMEKYIFETFDANRERSLVITKLQEARLWLAESKMHNTA